MAATKSKELRGWAKTCSEKTHCPKGHPLSGNNLKKYELSIGKRACKTCNNEKQRERNKLPKTKNDRLTWQRSNKDKISKYNKGFRDEHPNYSSDWDKENPEARKAINNRHEAKPERKAYHVTWNIENPKVATDYPLETRIAMLNVGYKYNWTCQWYKCGLTNKQSTIEINHIFPISEHPELQEVEQYMIPYCAYHHWLWHDKRKDQCAYIMKGRLKQKRLIHD